MSLFSKLKSEFKRKVTIMLIPHGKIKPVKVSISLLVFSAVLVSWTGVTLWAGYLASQHIDYVKIKADNKIMQIRLLVFANQLEQTKGMIEKLQTNDEKIRSLLAMNSKKSIIEDDLNSNSLGQGGPTPSQASSLAAVLSGNLDTINYNNIAMQTSKLNEQYQYMQESFGEIMSYIEFQKSLYMATPLGWPASGIVTSKYGVRSNPFFKTRDFHTGVDIANVKNTPIHATADGKVVFSGWQSGYGNIVVIDHGHGFRTTYAHLAQRLVKVGAEIKRGQIIAKMGATGTATGNHVHYEVQYNGRHTNPTPYLKDHYYQIAKGN